MNIPWSSWDTCGCLFFFLTRSHCCCFHKIILNLDFFKCYFMFIFTCLFSHVQCNFVCKVSFNLPNRSKYVKTIMLLSPISTFRNVHFASCFFEASHFLSCKAGRIHSFRYLSVTALPHANRLFLWSFARSFKISGKIAALRNFGWITMQA